MSLIKTLAESLKDDGNQFRRRKSSEEIEVEKALPGMEEISQLEIAVDFRAWKATVEGGEDLTFSDFLDYIEGKDFEKKPIVTKQVKGRALESFSSELKLPTITKQ